MDNEYQSIPIVKVTVDHMQYAIMQALDPEILSQQLQQAAKAAVSRINFEKMIANTVYRLTDEILNDNCFIDPLRDRLSDKLAEARDAMLNE